MNINESSVEHIDKIGRTLFEGDCVVFVNGEQLSIGTIIKLNPKMVKICEIGAKGFWARGINRYPQDTVKLDSPDVTAYLLKQIK